MVSRQPLLHPSKEFLSSWTCIIDRTYNFLIFLLNIQLRVYLSEITTIVFESETFYKFSQRIKWYRVTDRIGFGTKFALYL
jgi:hypothetical protein